MISAPTLVFSPHADDETLGMGGVIHHLRRQGCPVSVRVFAMSDHQSTRHGRWIDTEDRREEFRRAMGALGVDDFEVYGWPEGELDRVPLKELVTRMDADLATVRPASVFYPHPEHHQDHRQVHRAVQAALRPRFGTPGPQVFMYEYPYAADWPPAVEHAGELAVRLTAGDAAAKTQAMAAYGSQLSPSFCEHLVEQGRLLGQRHGASFAERLWFVRGSV